MTLAASEGPIAIANLQLGSGPAVLQTRLSRDLPHSRIGSSKGSSSYVRPFSSRPVRSFRTPPHCLKKKGTFRDGTASRSTAPIRVASSERRGRIRRRQ